MACFFNQQQLTPANNLQLTVMMANTFPQYIPLTVKLALLLLGLLLLPSANASNRVALVIGNADYREMPLANPRNDAKAMQEVLQKANFDVITALDADLKSMQTAILDFTSRLNENSTALFFYAGHGVQANGRNYLLPVDAHIESERSLRFNSLELTDVLDELENSPAKIKMVILDACRNNPFERSLRGTGRGLAAVDAARGTLIAYATAPGATASDGEGDNGLYTQALLQAMQKPGLKVEEVFKETRIHVADASKGTQIPWESSSLTGDFIFIDMDKKQITVSGDYAIQNASSTAAADKQQQAFDREALFWSSIKDSEDPQMLNAYLTRYPDGHFADLAGLRLARLQAEPTPAALSNSPQSSLQNSLQISQPEPQTATTQHSCHDLAGQWSNTPSAKATCAPKALTLSRDGDNRYSVSANACAVSLTGQAHYEQSTLVLDWKMATCTGTTTYTLDEHCQTGKGTVKVNRGLLCVAPDTTETISRL